MKSESEILSEIKELIEEKKLAEDIRTSYFFKNKIFVLNLFKKKYNLNWDISLEKKLIATLFKIDVEKCYKEVSEAYIENMNLKTQRIMTLSADVKLEFNDHEMRGYIEGKEINIASNTALNAIITADYDNQELYSEIYFVNGTDKKHIVNRIEKEYGNQWLDNELRNLFQLKQTSISLYHVDKVYLSRLLLDIIKDNDKIIVNANGLLHHSKINTDYLFLNKLTKSRIDKEIEMVKKKFIPKNTSYNNDDILYFANFQTFFIQCLKKEISNYFELEPNNICRVLDAKLTNFSISLLNNFYMEALKADYKVSFRGDDLNNNITVYSGEDVLLSLSASQTEDIAENIYNTIQQDISNNIFKISHSSQLVSLINKLKQEIRTIKPDFDEDLLSFELSEGINLNNIKKETIPLIMTYCENKLCIEYSLSSLPEKKVCLDNIKKFMINNEQSFLKKKMNNEAFIKQKISRI